MPRGAAAQASMELNPCGDFGALGNRWPSAGRAMTMLAQLWRSRERCRRTKRESRGRQWRLSGARSRQGEAPGASGEMQFARRIALLAHDALLSRRRASSVNLSGEVARKASTRHRHAATAPNNPIRRRRIEFNSSSQRTATNGTLLATQPTTHPASKPPFRLWRTLRPLNSNR